MCLFNSFVAVVVVVDFNPSPGSENPKIKYIPLKQILKHRIVLRKKYKGAYFKKTPSIPKKKKSSIPSFSKKAVSIVL